jgi:hypothetical protein
MGILFKRALYRELRSSVGYYDARRIVRRIEDAGEINNVEEIGRVLREAGFDERQITYTLKAAERNLPLLKSRLA